MRSLFHLRPRKTCGPTPGSHSRIASRPPPPRTHPDEILACSHPLKFEPCLHPATAIPKTLSCRLAIVGDDVRSLFHFHPKTFTPYRAD